MVVDVARNARAAAANNDRLGTHACLASHPGRQWKVSTPLATVDATAPGVTDGRAPTAYRVVGGGDCAKRAGRGGDQHADAVVPATAGAITTDARLGELSTTAEGGLQQRGERLDGTCQAGGDARRGGKQRGHGTPTQRAGRALARVHHAAKAAQAEDVLAGRDLRAAGNGCDTWMAGRGAHRAQVEGRGTGEEAHRDRPVERTHAHRTLQKPPETIEVDTVGSTHTGDRCGCGGGGGGGGGGSRRCGGTLAPTHAKANCFKIGQQQEKAAARITSCTDKATTRTEKFAWSSQFANKYIV